MFDSFGFCDLCINLETFDSSNLRTILNRLYQMGYKTVAVNQTIDESIFETEKKKKNKKDKKDNQDSKVPKQPSILIPYDLDELINEFSGKLNILKRVTFVFNDSSKTYSLNQLSALKKFNLYSVTPTSQAALQFTCSQLNTDIINISKESNGLRLSRKLYSQAVERGIHFEINYADLISNESRKHTLYNAHLFHMYGKSKNVIISSGASSANSIRSPYDIINLGFILGLNEIKSKAAVLSNCKHVIFKAESRRYGKALFTIKVAKDEDDKSNDDAIKPPDIKKLKLETSA